MGNIDEATGETPDVERSRARSPLLLFDAIVVADGAWSVDALLRGGHTRELMRDVYRNRTALIVLKAGAQLPEARVMRDTDSPMI